eukprot:g12623.t1
MSSSGAGGGRGRGGSGSGRGGGRGRGGRPSRSSRSDRGPKPSSTTSTTGNPTAAAVAKPTPTPAPLPLPPASTGPAATGKREDGLVPGAGLMALQALAAAQKKSEASLAASAPAPAPASAARGGEKAVVAPATTTPKVRGGRGGVSGGGRSSSSGRGSSSSSRGATGAGGRAAGDGTKSAAGAAASTQSGRSSKGRGERGGAVSSTAGRGGVAAAVAAAAKGSQSSSARGGRGDGAGGGRGGSSKGGSGRKSSGKEAGARPLSEAEEREKSQEAVKQLAAQKEQRKKAEEERRRKAEEDRKAVEEQRARRDAEEKERKRKAEAQARKKEAEDKKNAEAKRKAEERRKKAEEKRQKALEDARKAKEEAERKEREKRLEAEKIEREAAKAAAEEKRQKEEEQERVRREFEAQLEAVSQLELLQKEERARRELREKHAPEALKLSRESHEANKSKLKSDLKKTTAFTKKVKQLSEDQRASLDKDLETLNLSRYVSEIVDAVAENKLKNADVSVAVHLCCLMHQRYPEFAEDLVAKLAGPFVSAPGDEEREEKELLRRKRSNLRLLTELHAVGVFDGSRLIVRIVRSLCGLGQEGKDAKRPRPGPTDARLRDHQLHHQTVTAAPPPLRDTDVTVLAGFVRAAGEDMVGVLQRKTVNIIKLAGEMGKLEREPIVDAEVKARLRSMVDGVFSALSTHLERGHEQLGRLEQKMEKDRLTNGSLTEDKEKNLEESRKAYEALLGNVTSLASSLNRDMPQLPEHEEEEEGPGGISLWEGGVGGDGTGYTGPFEEAERSFYEDLPDLLSTVPPNLLGLTEEQAEQLRDEERRKQKEERSAIEDVDGGEGAEEGSGEAGKDGPGDGDVLLLAKEMKGLAVIEEGVEREEDGGGGSDEEDEDGKGEGDGDEDGEDGEGGEYISRNSRLTLMLEDELPNCHNQERVDEFAKKFCYVNSKSARKKLVKALFNVPRQALDLLPMYARLVAILDKAMKTIAPVLLEELRSHFRYFLRKKAPGQIDHRIKNVRFIGELVKFRVAPPVVAFQCLKSCLDDFSSLAVQTMAALLETCGRFLFRQKLTHQRTRTFLTVMMKLKKAKNLDKRLEAVVDNAFYTCCPPERQQRAAKVRTPLQLYVRHLMLEKLRDDPDVVEGVIKQLRKLPWQDPEAGVESEVVRASLRLCRTRYPCIHLAADVLSGLARHQDRVAVKAVDAVLEVLHRGIELPGGGGREFQRLVGYARLLAEMYNYAVVGSPTVFETLHLLLDSGHEVPPEMKQPRPDPRNPSRGAMLPPAAAPSARFDPRVRSAADPPGDCLRIRLVVAILEGCGSYFVRGAGLGKLTKFLAVFQRYLFCKERLPAGTEFAVLDLLDDLESGAKAARNKDRAKAKKAAQEAEVKGRGRSRKDKTEKEAEENDDPILPRYRTWEEAQAEVEVADRAWGEENRRRMSRVAELQGRRDEEAGDTAGDGDGDDDGGTDDDEDEDEEEDDDDERGEGSGGSGSEGEQEAGERGNAEEDGNSSGAPQEAGHEEGGLEAAGDEVVLNGYGAGGQRTEEDTEAEDEFEALLSKTMSESVEKSKIARATTQVMGHMAVPMVLKNTNVRGATQEAPLTGGLGVAFKLLKRGNKGKMEAQEVVVPASTSLAAQVNRNEEASREESSIIKARVLAYEANIEAAVLAQDAGTTPLPEDYTQFIPKRASLSCTCWRKVPFPYTSKLLGRRPRRKQNCCTAAEKMQRAPASGGPAGLSAPPAPTLTEALEQTRTVLDEKRPWYQALILQKQAVEAHAGESVSGVITAEIVDGFSFSVNAVNVDLLRPVCFGLQELFAAVEGSTAAREELIDLLGYCVTITSNVLNQTLLADLPEHIKRAVGEVEAEIKAINGSARLFDTKIGCSLPCRRLRLHAKDREAIQGHRVRLQEILRLATQATVFDTNAVVRQTRVVVADKLQGPPTPDMAREPKAAPPLPKSYVARTSLLDDVVKLTMAADNAGAPHALFGMGGSGKTVLASALVSDDRIRKHFRRGVFWIKVGKDCNLVDVLERLAARVIVDPAGPIEFNTEEDGIQRLTAWTAKDPQPRLVVLDDVWDSEVVNALRYTGLRLVVTTRVRDVVGEEPSPAAHEHPLATPQGKYSEAGPLYERCQAVEERALGPEHPHLAITLLSRADLLQSQGKYSEAGPLYERCQAIQEKALGPEHPHLAITLLSRAQLLESQGKYSEAGPLYERCQAIQEKALGPEHPSLAATLHNRAQLLESQGKYPEAGPLYERCQVIEEKALGPEHPSLAATLHNRAQLLKSQGKYSEAGPLYERCQAIEEKALGPEHPNLAITLLSRAALLESQGEYSEAGPLYERCQVIQEKALGPEHPNLAITLRNRAHLLESQGKYSEAGPLYERCQVIQEKALGPEHPSLAATLHNRAQLLESQERYSEAITFFERAVSIRKAFLGGNHEDTVKTDESLERTRRRAAPRGVDGVAGACSAQQ